MAEPIFLSVTDFNNNTIEINIKHIYSISEDQHRFDKDFITTIAFYHVPNCNNCGTTLFKTPERKESVLNRIKVLSSKENI